MVSLQRQYHLTPDGSAPIPRLRWGNACAAQRQSGCSTVHPEWDESVIPWRPSPACKICFTEAELHPPLEEVDPGFCCRCKKWKATECSACHDTGCGKCCKKRRGAVCRRAAEEVCQCAPIELNVECERAVRAAREAVWTAQRNRWEPNAPSRASRIPSSGNAPPLPVAVKESARRVPVVRPLRPASKSTFSTFPYRFCNSLVCIGPPVFGGGNTY